jgi:sialate O-acetylesterase
MVLGVHVSGTSAELRVPAVFGDHMVLQRGQLNSVWGWDQPGTTVRVTFAQQSVEAVAGSDGRWTLTLSPEKACSIPRVLRIQGTTTREIRDVLVGEVWLCSGQSNMAAPLTADYAGEIESAAATNPELRLLRIPNRGSQELQTDFDGAWLTSTPESAAKFSAIGYLFGSYLQRALAVPVGMIDNSWSSSTAEAWVQRTRLENDPRFKELCTRSAALESRMQSRAAWDEYEVAMKGWSAAVGAIPAGSDRDPPYKAKSPGQWLAGSKRIGNLYAGVVHPIVGFSLKGVLWYQGESNVEHAVEYEQLFPFLIEQWRRDWGLGDFPFYWVQLAAFDPGAADPSGTTWARLREAQTKALSLPNTGQAVMVDRGEGRDIHPRRKHDAATRLLRWALARDYGRPMPHHSPEFRSLATGSGTVTVTFDCDGSTLRSFESLTVVGFSVLGSDGRWHAVEGTIRNGNQVELACPGAASPVVVRYAWSNNPVCNLMSKDGLPATPFRTDRLEP